MPFDPTTARPAQGPGPTTRASTAFDPTTARSATDPSLRQVLTVTSEVAPDAAATAARLARQYPAAPMSILEDLPAYQRQAQIDANEQRLGAQPQLADALRRDPMAAAQAQDDGVPLSALAQIVNSFKRGFASTRRGADASSVLEAVQVLQVIGRIERGELLTDIDLAKATPYASIFAGAGRRPENLARLRTAYQQRLTDNVQDYVNRTRELQAALPSPELKKFQEQTGFGDALSALGESPVRIALQVAAESMGGLLPALPFIAAGGIAGGPYGLALTTGASSGSIEYLNALPGIFQELGVDITDRAAVERAVRTPEFFEKNRQAMIKAGVIGVIDAATAGLAGVRLARGTATNVAAQIGAQATGGAAGEALGSVASGQPVSASAVLSEAIGEIPSAVIDISTQVARSAFKRSGEVQEATDDAAKLQAALQTATDSKLRERNPEQFRTLMQELVQRADPQQGVPAQIYVDGQVLNQLAPEVRSLLPAQVQAQIQRAADIGDTVAIPVADVLTVAPGTPLEQVLVENARTDPNSMSQAEARVAGEQAQTYLQQESERVIKQAADQAAARASQEAVKQNIKQQLAATGRFRDAVNEGYATWAAAFYVAYGSRLGLTPEQFYQRYPLRVLGAAPGQQTGVLNAPRLGRLDGVEGFHFSKQDRPTIVTAAFGTGLEGSSREQYLNAADRRLRKRSYFYVDKGTGINPEAGVGGRGQRVNLDNVYDADADPLRLKTGRDQLGFESAVLDAGFAGYLTRMEGSQSGQVIMLGDQTFQAEVLGPLGRTQGRPVPPPVQRPAAGRDVVADALRARRDLPAGELTRQRWGEILQRLAPTDYEALAAAGVFEGEGRFYKDGLIREFESRTQAPTYAQSVTTMVPTTKGAVVDPTDVKVPGLEAADQPDEKSQKALAANVGTFEVKEQVIAGKPKRGYDSIKVEGNTPREKAESIIRQMVRNLRTIFAAIPKSIRQRSKLWYDGANRVSLAFADRYGLTPMQTAGQLAVTSPQADWYMNVSYVERINDILTYRQDHTWDAEMEAWAEAWINSKTQVEGRAKEAERKAQAVKDAVKAEKAAQRALDKAQADLEKNTPKLTEKIDAAEAALKEAQQAVKDAKKTGTPAELKRAEAQAGKRNDEAKAARKALRDAKSAIGKAETVLRQARADIEEKRASAAEPDENLAVQPLVRGKKLSELTTDFERAWWVRAYDEAHNPRSYRVVTPEGAFLDFAKLDDGTTNDSIGWKSFSAIAKAISIYRDGSLENVHAQLGGEHKVRNFYNNIFGPNSDTPFVTSDTHQVAANLFLPLGADALEVGQNFGGTGSKSVGATGLNGTYWLYHEAVVQAARAEGVKPREMQSISWEAIRNLFSPSFKANADSVAAVRDLWVKYQRGEATYEDTIRAVVDLAGGEFRSPAWVGTRPDSAAAPENGATSYESGLAHVGPGQQRRDQPGPGDQGVPGPGVLSQGGLTDGRPQPAGDRAGRYSSGGLAPLAGAPSHAGATGPIADVVAVAEQYARDNGIALKRQAEYVRVDPDLGRRIADAYTAMVHTPDDPRVQASYDALIRETRAQYDALVEAGYTFTFFDSANDPYKGNPWPALRDLRDNKAMAVYGTYDGYGNEVTGFETTKNLLVVPTGLQWPDQAGVMRDVTANDLFRAVHDAFGHGLEGAGFRGQGEANAFEAHARLFSPAAMMALTTETRAQNSWLNLNAALFRDMVGDARAEELHPDNWQTISVGEHNQTAKVEDTIFADQKNGILPEWTWTEGRAGDAAPEALQQGPRGTFNPATLELVLNPNADLSTWFHETGHFFLEVLADVASQPGAPAQIAEDYNKVLAWFGVTPEQWAGFTLDQKRPYHERWAESIEQYVMEGKAPSVELQPVMRRFAAWLKSVYQSIKQFIASRGMVQPGGETLGQVDRSRVGMNFKDVVKRTPELQAAAERVKAGEMTAAEYDALVNEFKPVEPYASVPAPATGAEIRAALTSDKVERVGVPSQTLQAGHPVGLRLDIPAYSNHGTWVVSVHEQEAGYNAGKSIGYEAVAAATGVTFGVVEKAAMNIASGKPKATIAVIKGAWKPTTAAKAKTAANRALNDPSWVQVGMDPERHSYFYDRATMTPVTAAEEVIQIGPLVLAKNPTYGDKAAFLFQGGQGQPSGIQLNDDIRRVMDRMLATDEQIQQANEVAGLMPDEQADGEAAERLQKRSIADLKWAVKARDKVIAKLKREAREIEKAMRAQVTAEVDQRPEVLAKAAIEKAEKEFEADPVAADMNIAAIADAFGYPSVEAMYRAIELFGDKRAAIDGLAERRMLEEHGDLIDERAIEQAANEAVHNEARARSLATELRTQQEMLNERADTGQVNARGARMTVNVLVEAAKQFGANVISRTPLKDLRATAWKHTAAERRAGKRWQEATMAGDTQAAVQAKQDQMLNNAAAKAALEATAESKKILEFFARVTKGNDEKTVEKGRDPDIVNAARAVLAAYGVQTPASKGAAAYLEVLQRNDPDTYNAVAPMMAAATQNAQPLEALTFEELQGLNEQIRAMWFLAKRSRQMEVAGNLLDIDDAAQELFARMEEIGIPDRVPGEGMAVTRAEERGLFLKQGIAFLRRVEQWAEGMDGKYGGPFLRLVFQPIKDAADRYRKDRIAYRKRFQVLVDNLAPIVGDSVIEAPELGYTFGTPGSTAGTAMNEILHAIAHTGNDSNKRKLLLGRGWATENPDGTLNTTQWDAFIQRLVNEGKLERAHFDFVQGVWDLLEETKGDSESGAQKAHRDAFGRFFSEVTANAFVDPFGVTRRGGYVPAQVDSRLVKDNALRKLAEEENNSMAFAFPQPAKGFTMARTEYNRPLMLDLRSLSQHIDKVLLFSHMTNPARDVRKLLTRKTVSQPLDRIQPAALESMLQPWLQRSAQQIVETPIVGSGKWARLPGIIRARAGMALMFANVSNAVQQITGLSTAAVRVKPSFLMRSVAQYVANPRQFSRAVWGASPYMDDRAKNEVAVLNEQMQAILIKPSTYERAQDWGMRHAYFLQTALDNVLSPIVWTGAFNQALADGLSNDDAIRFADSTVRQTQGSTLPEDVSRLETGPAYARAFTQFLGYFNMMANTNGTALKQIAGEVGLKKGAGKALYVVMMGFMAPIWIAEAIALAFRGGPEDEDDDGYLDDWLAEVFGMGTLKGLLAQVPIIGQFGVAAAQRFNDNPLDDRVSLSPAVSLLESSVGAPQSVYKAIVEDGSAQKAIRDVATLVSVATGVPIYGLARPIGYAAGVAQGKIEPEGPGDLARGLITGTASPESKQR